MTLDEQLRRTLDTLSERLRGEVSAYLDRATKDLISAAAAERTRIAEEVARDARAEAEREISVRLRTLEGDETIIAKSSVRKVAGRGGVVSQARIGTQAAGLAAAEDEEPALDPDVQAGRDLGDHDADGARLLESIRALDQARSLSAILDALVVQAGKEAPRAGVFLANGSPLRSWRCTGFELTVDQSKPFDLPIDEAGIISTAIRTGTTTVSAAGGPPAPAFARLPRACEAIAVPLSLAGQVVAVLYADSGTTGALKPGRLAALEVLARHAARLLEVVTAFRTARMLAGRADAPSAPAVVPAESIR